MLAQSASHSFVLKCSEQLGLALAPIQGSLQPNYLALFSIVGVYWCQTAMIPKIELLFYYTNVRRRTENSEATLGLSEILIDHHYSNMTIHVISRVKNTTILIYQEYKFSSRDEQDVAVFLPQGLISKYSI